MRTFLGNRLFGRGKPAYSSLNTITATRWREKKKRWKARRKGASFPAKNR